MRQKRQACRASATSVTEAQELLPLLTPCCASCNLSDAVICAANAFTNREVTVELPGGHE